MSPYAKIFRAVPCQHFSVPRFSVPCRAKIFCAKIFRAAPCHKSPVPPFRAVPERPCISDFQTTPAPPNFGLSRQALHLPQSFRRHPLHLPQRWRLLRLPLEAFGAASSSDETPSDALPSSSNRSPTNIGRHLSCNIFNARISCERVKLV